MGKNIPVYSISQFKKDPIRKKLYQVEVFDKNRDFNVEYPHRHDNFYEILFITHGSGTYTIDFKSHEIKPGFIFFVSPGQVHTIEFSDDIRGYIFIFTSEFFLAGMSDQNKLIEYPFFHALSKDNPRLLVSNSSEFSLLFELACRESSEDSSTNDSIARAALELILNLCHKYYPEEKQLATGKGQLLVKRFKQLIEGNYKNYHTVSHYAELLNVTASHLNEMVKLHTGLTAKEHITERQLLEIKRLLSHTELSISEIAYSLNFEDQSYFSRFFKKHTGVSPASFRNSMFFQKKR